MLENWITDCKIQLKMVNPKRSAKERFLYGELQCLVILDDFDDYVPLKTNEAVINRNIRKSVGGNFTVEHIVDITPLKRLGKSLATY